jgi:hypothetical protein
VNRHRFTGAVAALVALGLTATSVYAGLLSNGPLTRDTETGNEWLDLSYTVARTPYSVETDPTLGGTVSGFHAASAAELETLMNSVGLTLGLSLVPSAYTPVDTILTFVGTLFVDPLNRWKESFIIVTDGPSFDATKRYGFQIRVDEVSSFPASGTTQQWPSTFSYLQAGSTRASILVRSAPNGSPATAIAPTAVDPVTGAVSFSGTGLGAWFNVLGQIGDSLLITTTDGSNITHFSLPQSAADGDGVYTVFDPLLGEVEVPFGDVHVLGQPSSFLRIGGLFTPFPGVSAFFTSTGDSQTPFPIFLQFDSPSASFVVTPEPATGLLITFHAAILARRTRRQPLC